MESVLMRALDLKYLPNKKVVGNFNIPIPIIFEDGTVLKGRASYDTAQLQTLTIMNKGREQITKVLTTEFIDEAEIWKYYYDSGEVDIVFCTEDAIRLLKEKYKDLTDYPFRGVSYVYINNKKFASIEMQCM